MRIEPIRLCPPLFVAAAAVMPLARSAPQDPEPAPTTRPAATTSFDAEFPTSWIGTWSGSLEVRQTGKEEPAATSTMSLEVAPLESEGDDRQIWRWKITYGEGDDAQTRDYRLIRLADSPPGEYFVNEGNGVLIDAFVVGPALHSRYWVGDLTIDAVYERRGDELDVMLSTFTAKPRRTTGRGVPAVASYGLNAVQRARLTRTD